MFSLLKKRNFLLFFFGQSISEIGDYILYIVLPFYTYNKTGSILSTGIMFVSLTLPSAIFGPLSGILSDRLNKKTIMIYSDIFRATIIFMILLFQNNFVAIYILVFMESVVSAFFTTAKNSFIPLLVNRDELHKTNLLMLLTGSFLKVLTPFLGGFIMARFGISFSIIIDATTYVLSVYSMVFITTYHNINNGIAGDEKNVLKSVMADIKSGIKYIKECFIGKVLVLISLEMFGQGVFTSLIIPYIKSYFSGSVVMYGILMSLQGFGGLIGILLVGSLNKKINIFNIFWVSSLTIGIIIIFVIASRERTLLFIAFIIIGLLSVAHAASSNTIIQSGSDDKYVGRVFGILSSVGSISVVCGIVYGSVFGDMFGTYLIIASSGIFFFISGILSITFRKEIPANQMQS